MLHRHWFLMPFRLHFKSITKNHTFKQNLHQSSMKRKRNFKAFYTAIYPKRLDLGLYNELNQKLLSKSYYDLSSVTIGAFMKQKLIAQNSQEPLTTRHRKIHPCSSVNRKLYST